jgi:hypothetical protein
LGRQALDEPGNDVVSSAYLLVARGDDGLEVLDLFAQTPCSVRPKIFPVLDSTALILGALTFRERILALRA